MPYHPPDQALDTEFLELIALAGASSADPLIQERANTLALKIRSRRLDLATWKADGSPEDRKRDAQCRQLTVLAGAKAHPILVAELDQTPDSPLQP